jgi:hypothetical protein
MKKTIAILLLALMARFSSATEFHVATNGNDANRGTKAAPMRTIQRAAELAQPGDVVTVHEGVYRERINPPRGGTSDKKRIVYQAAPGEKVEIKGSEAVKNWTKVQDDVWKVTLPNSLFGGFNPYSDLIRGDWFNPKGREHHTGAVYLNGEWLIEAASLDEVLGKKSAMPQQSNKPVLLNVAWLRPRQGAKIPAIAFAARQGTRNAPCDEGGECVGWISHGDWLRYERVDFGAHAETLELRTAAAGQGGTIEVRLDAPDGELLGTCTVPHTGGWQSWTSFTARLKPLGGVRTLCLVFKDPSLEPLNAGLWHAQVDATNTTIWAQFRGVNPNEQLVEVNVRRTVFYPDKPGRNFITVRGFTMRHAATPWAPPTAEQIGLIGTHWSKGWIIESNTVSHSICSGIALGKHGDEFDNTSANSAEGYVKTIERAHAHPIAWTGKNIGHHIVRNNHISYCEQAGIVGSLGCAFSTVTGNVIHDIHVRRLFTGAEMAGIKFHAAIDTEISRNHIYRTCRGLWLDWMAQGTRVTRNLFHDNGPSEDLFVEVNHGPFVVDNNIFLSATTLLDVSEGGAYAHNLIAGKIISQPEPRRDTPYHPAHSTKIAGLVNTKGGDDRFYNNIFVGAAETPSAAPKGKKPAPRSIGFGLWVYDNREFPLQTGGNVYLNGARPYGKETNPLTLSETFDCKLTEAAGEPQLHLTLPASLSKAVTKLVTTELLGKAMISGARYVNPNDSPLKIDGDYLGKKRSKSAPTAGPFENPSQCPINLRIW